MKKAKRLKIAVVIPTHSDIFSSLNNLLKVYRWIAKNKNADVTIFTDFKNKAAYEGLDVEKITGFDNGTIISKILFFLGIPRFYYSDLVQKLSGYDVIESSNPEFYIFAYQSYLAAKKYKSRLILRTSQTVEGFYLFWISKFAVVPFAKKAYDFSKCGVFTNPQAKQRCIKLGLIDYKKRAVVTGHATDTRCFRPKKNPHKNDFVVLSVGGLYEIKGHHIIIRALERIIRLGHDDAELWIVGEGYYKGELVRLAKELGIEDRVKFLGKKNHNELADIYNSSSVFVLANLQEITPAVNEAMACQRPVVAMECGGYEFVIENRKSGLISKRFDVNDMADKIVFIKNNPEFAKSIAANGRKKVVENFSIEKVGQKIYMACTK